MFAGHAGPYEEASRKVGDVVQTKVYPEAAHIDPQSDLWPDILRSTRALVGR